MFIHNSDDMSKLSTISMSSTFILASWQLVFEQKYLYNKSLW